MYTIYIEDLIANSIIELSQIDGSRKVNIKKAEKYGNAVIKKLKDQGITADLRLSRDLTAEFEYSYSAYFSVNRIDSRETEYILNPEKTIDDLIKRFRAYLPLDVLIAFMDEEVVKEGLNQKKDFIPKELTMIIDKIIDNPKVFYENISKELSSEEYNFLKREIEIKNCRSCRNESCRVESSEKPVDYGHAWINNEMVGRQKVLTNK